MGITRNTPAQTAKDGEMDELINLRYKDGALRPTPSRKVVLSGVNYSPVYVHAGPGYKHYLGVSESKLYYFADDVAGVPTLKETPVELTGLLGSISMTTIGNVVVLTERPAMDDVPMVNIEVQMYDNTNGLFKFDGETIPASGKTYTVETGTLHIITGHPNAGHFAAMELNDSIVGLPFTFAASSPPYVFTPGIGTIPPDEFTISFSAYNEGQGEVVIRYNLTDYLVNPAGEDFLLPYGTSYYIEVTPLNESLIGVIQTGGVVVGGDHYEDEATNNMTFNITFIPY